MRKWSFNSRPHKEVDLHRGGSAKRPESFNSRPHKEVDWPALPDAFQSNHTFNSRPHKEVDQSHKKGNSQDGLSIHDLTRRSTGCSNYFVVIQIFQFTTSQGGRPSTSLPHLLHSIFQFTTSQGGRRFRRIERLHRLSPFNSRPHKEVDGSMRRLQN